MNQQKQTMDVPYLFKLKPLQMVTYTLIVSVVGGLLFNVFKEPVADAEIQVQHVASFTHPPIDRLEFEKAMSNTCISFDAFDALATKYTELGYGTAPSFPQMCGKKAPVPKQADKGAKNKQGKPQAQG